MQKSAILLAGFGVALALTWQANSQEPEKADQWPLAKGNSSHSENSSEYNKWIKSYQTPAREMPFGDKLSKVKVIVTAIEGDDEQTSSGQNVFAMDSKRTAYGVQVSVSGLVKRFLYNSRGIKGGGYPQIAAQDLKRLDQLLRNLPDDGSRLPPPSRKLLIQARDEVGHVKVRVYDRANAPAPVLEILRLTLSGIRSSVPEFKPVNQWDANQKGDGALNISRDGQTIISSYWFGPLKFWDRETRKLNKQVITGKQMSIEGLELSPTQPVAAIPGGGAINLLNTETWKRFRVFSEPSINGVTQWLHSPQFTADGRLLLVRSNQPELQVYETKSWRRVAFPANWSQSAVCYFPEAKTNRAVFGNKENTVALWDAKRRRIIAKLDQNARVHSAVFSPDRKLVAVVTTHKGAGYYWSVYRIRVWRADTGALVRELKPFEQGTCESVEGLLWSPDSRYLLAGTKSDSFFSSIGISVWSLKSGRHRGEFVGSPGELTGLVLLPDGKLISGCQDGKIRIWDTIQALKSISDFEASLGSEMNS